MLRYLCDTLSVPISEQFSESVAQRKPMGYETQVMSKDKYPSIFFCQNGGYPSNILLNMCNFENWGILLGYSPVCSIQILHNNE